MQVGELGAIRLGLVFAQAGEVRAGGDVADGGHDLQLRGALVDVRDAGVAVEAFAGVVLHEARSAVHLDGVVRVAVGELRRHALAHRGEGVGQLGVALLLLALLGRQLALAGDVVEGLVDVHVAGRLVEHGAGGVGAGTHEGEHLVDGGELDDGAAELSALVGVLVGFAPGGFAEAHGLRHDAEAGAVHERHDVLDEAQATLAAQLGGGVVEDQLAGGRSLDAHLILDAADVDAAVALVVDEHGEAAAVAGALFGAGQDEVDVRVAVGDEALHAVQSPALRGLVVGGLEHDGLQVAAGVGLGEVHRHRFAGADARDVAAVLILVAELVERLGAVLQAPEVLEARIGA